MSTTVATSSRKEARLRASQDRKCSYCGEPVTTGSCPTLKKHKHYADFANAEARVGILKYLRKEGIGPGALMVIGERYLDREKTNTLAVWEPTS